MLLVRVAMKRYSEKREYFFKIEIVRKIVHAVQDMQTKCLHAHAQASTGQDTEVRPLHGLTVTLEAGKPVSPCLVLK